MKLYNTLTRSLEDFTPLRPPVVTMYVCGPTVYDAPHIGHARSAYIFDVLRRYVEFQFKDKGYKVKFVRNVTDVDDKIIERARQELGAGGGGQGAGTGGTGQGAGDLKAKCAEVVERYLKNYHEAMDRLGLARPDLEPKATEHVVPQMTDFIAQLLMNGVAYEAKGDVYFAVRKFAEYGKLSKRTLDELQVGSRVEPDEQKRDPLDFALWKAAKPGEPSWKSPWGAGRPGWHIECSAMSTKYLGDQFDIHGGGVDLVFPHHENEVAQAHAAGKPFARWWVHNGLLTVNGEKMSKSLGNFVTVEQALAECGGQADVLKLFFLGTHYRSPVDYTAANVQGARARYESLYGFLARAGTILGTTPVGDVPAIHNLRDNFQQAMDEDLNTPQALAVLDEMENIGYRSLENHQRARRNARKAAMSHAASPPVPASSTDPGYDAMAAAMAIRELGARFGLFAGFSVQRVPTEVQSWVDAREEARLRRDFATADRLRGEIEVMGYVIEDTSAGPVVLPKR